MKRHEFLDVATSGSVRRTDKCGYCETPLYYRVDDAEHITESFCPNAMCQAFLLSIREPERAGGAE